jgi:hypothetical protein
MNNFGNRNFMQPMGRLNLHSFKFGVGVWVWGGFFHFSLVPNDFPSGSQYVPWVLNVFPKGVSQ